MALASALPPSPGAPMTPASATSAGAVPDGAGASPAMSLAICGAASSAIDCATSALPAGHVARATSRAAWPLPRTAPPASRKVQRTVTRAPPAAPVSSSAAVLEAEAAAVAGRGAGRHVGGAQRLRQRVRQRGVERCGIARGRLHQHADAVGRLQRAGRRQRARVVERMRQRLARGEEQRKDDQRATHSRRERDRGEEMAELALAAEAGAAVGEKARGVGAGVAADALDLRDAEARSLAST